MIDLLHQRLAAVAPTDARQEERALREILQELALYGLWRGGLFQEAAFQGGTALRIVHGLRRFSEDLDFILKRPDAGFRWQPRLTELVEVLADFGVRCELVERARMDQAVRQAVLKDESLARQMNLSFFRGESGRKLRVKLEVDTCPPAGSGFDYHYLEFPLDFEICVQDLPSNFALKLHALLCRPYIKGRDWFDFAWYVTQRVAPNLPHLQAALRQSGPWQGTSVEVDMVWLREALRERIRTIPWADAARDVEPFLGATDRPSLALWSERFFTDKVAKLQAG